MNLQNWFNQKITNNLFEVFLKIFIVSFFIILFINYLNSKLNIQQIFNDIKLQIISGLKTGDKILLTKSTAVLMNNDLILEFQLLDVNNHTLFKKVNDRSTFYLLSFKSEFYLLDEAELNWGKLIIHWNYEFKFLMILFFLTLIIFFTSFSLIKMYLGKITDEIGASFATLSDQVDSERPSDLFLKISELNSVYKSLIDSKNNLLSAEKMKNQQETHQKLIIQSQQVAHDIRSPISALNMIMGTLSDLSEDKRLIIRHATQRMNDIANNLLQTGKVKSQSMGCSVKVHKKSKILLSSVIDSIVSEKRTEYRDKINIKIEADLKNSFGLFVEVCSIELSRVISNLVNNSIEALINQAGKVDVVVSGDHNYVIIEICDNGKGMGPEILEKLGQEGFSYGKENTHSGSGIGVFHAMNAIKKWNGQLKINSVENQGSKFQIILPRVEPSLWFLSEIQIPKNSVVISVDDDLSIHQIWKDRLESANAFKKNITLQCFTSAEIFLNLNISSEMIFLIDYEFLNQKENGLDLIRSKNIFDRSFLVTSRDDELQILESCQKLNIKLLPKSLAGFVPIKII